ncbi:MAG: glutathione S-transferase [Gammaproteobacteria bacterium]|nr:glutathione S-transferase [Gammaproteobacteria bacterium]MDX2459007.1 glutathione S-transferase [Gammaproteobacteria bacterium]
MTSEYVLYCFAQSGNAYKTALMLNLCGADWSPRFVDYFNREVDAAPFRAINEMGEVPVLEHNGKRLSQSGVILDYLATSLGRFNADNDDDRREILRWILFDNHKLTSYTATLRWLLTFSRSAEPAVLEFLKVRSKAALGVLDAHLREQRFAIGDRPTIADISMCGYLYFRDELGVDLNAYPAVLRWLADIEALDGWVHPYQLMPGHPLT